MFMKLFVPLLLAISPALSVPIPQIAAAIVDLSPPAHVVARDTQNFTTRAAVPLNDTATRFPDMGTLSGGNQEFRSNIASSANPNLLKDLASKGQFPGFLFLGCRFVRSSFLSHLVVSITDSPYSFLVVLR